MYTAEEMAAYAVLRNGNFMPTPAGWSEGLLSGRMVCSASLGWATASLAASGLGRLLHV